jgi:hypothetical protein
MKVVEDCPERSEVGAVEAVSVDRADGDDPDADGRGVGDDGVEERLAVGRGDLLRVVQRRQPTHPGAAQQPVVEEDAGDDERPRERASARLVRARDVADAEAPVVSEEPLAGGPSHAAEDRR